jgi:solute carrier family 30 (zinc transporter), member 1
MIASVHIQVNLPQNSRVKQYHAIAKAIRTCLHAYGIHSSTIQPEFTDTVTSPTAVDNMEGPPLLLDLSKACMFECVGGGACVDSRCCDGDRKDKQNGKNVGALPLRES